MMSLTASLSLALASFVFVMTPGPGVLAILAKALVAGRFPASILGLGLVLGDAAYLLLALTSLQSLASGLGSLMVLVRWLGAGWLIWLGWRQFHAPLLYLEKPVPAGDGAGADNAANAPHRDGGNSVWALLLTGFFISGSNPKVILFYLSFLPLFLDLDSLSAQAAIQAFLIIVAVLVAGVLLSALLAAEIRHFAKSPARARWINRIAGSLLIAVGFSLILLV